jgi:hypothetical protein
MLQGLRYSASQPRFPCVEAHAVRLSCWTNFTHKLDTEIAMTIEQVSRQKRLTLGTALITCLLGSGLFAGTAAAEDIKVTLTGAEEIPPVAAKGTGTGTISIDDDGSVSGSVTTMGVAGTAAHIHMGAPGKNGPVAIALVKDGDTYAVPAAAKLTAEQMESFANGDLYVNVHTPAPTA